jgi:hypothetical protein
MRLLVLSLILISACSSEPGESLQLGLGGDCSLRGEAGCGSGYCARLDSGAAVCSSSCGSSSACPGGWVCRDDRQPSLCVPAANKRECKSDTDCPVAHRCAPGGACVIPAQRAHCLRCSDAMQCSASLLCQQVGEGLGEACLNPCDNGNCTEGADCVDGACVPVGACGLAADLCSACLRDAECGGRDDYCVRNLQLAASFCARDCSEQPCPSGFRCQGFEFGSQCVPEDGQCTGRCLGDRDCPQGFACNDGRCAHLAEHRGLCAPCGDDGDCAAGLCIQSAGGSRVCAPLCGDAQECPSGGVCGAVSGSQTAVCLPRSGHCPVGVGAAGRRCSVAVDCSSGLCLRATDETKGRCVEACVAGVCAEGLQCSTLGGVAVCLQRDGADGAACSNGATCAGGLCVSLASESICSRACAADLPCEEGWRCSAVSGDRQACLPQTDGGGLGAMCHAGAASCSSGLCLVQRSGPLCTQLCQANSDCPDGWGCAFVEGRGMPEGGASVCLPEVVAP